jgi:hypothetical protein
MTEDSTPSKQKQSGGGRAFHSRLEPFVDFIREQRLRRKTWKETAALLAADKGCPISAQGAHQFYRRYLHRQVRPHWESEPVKPLKPLTPPEWTTPDTTKPTNPHRFKTDI